MARTAAFLPRSTVRFLALTLALSLGGGCHAAAKPVPPDWIVLDAGPFTLRAPPTMRVRHEQGIDSTVGMIEGAGLRIDYDLGVHSDPLEPVSDAQGYSAREVTLDGRPARLATFYAPQRDRARPYVVGVHFPRLAQSSLGAIKLTIVAAAATAASRDTAERMFKTLRVRTPR